MRDLSRTTTNIIGKKVMAEETTAFIDEPTRKQVIVILFNVQHVKNSFSNSIVGYIVEVLSRIEIYNFYLFLTIFLCNLLRIHLIAIFLV
jgi:hypothetical protein